MLTWFRRLDDAKTVGEVLALARDYVATLPPQDIARLPARCRPGRIRDEADIERLHAILVEEFRESRAEGDDLVPLQRLTSFMVRASVRLAELAGDSPGPGPGGSSPGTSTRRALGARDD